MAVITREEVYGRVTNLLVNSLCVDEEIVLWNAKIKEDLGAESLDLLDIGFHLKREFHLQDDVQWEGIDTIEMLVDQIVAKLNPLEVLDS